MAVHDRYPDWLTLTDVGRQLANELGGLRTLGLSINDMVAFGLIEPPAGPVTADEIRPWVLINPAD